MKSTDNNFFYHLFAWFIFWAVPLMVNFQILFSDIKWMWVSNISILIISSAWISYFNYYFFIHYFDKKKYEIYAIGMFVVLLLSFLIIPNVISPIPFKEINIEQDKVPPYAIVALTLSTLFRFARKGIQKDAEFKEATQKRTEMELKLLQMQLQPHFLFNCLNNLYAFNLFNHTKANEMILQLADLLRYQLEIGKREKISLIEEISFAENYIALEKIRLYNCDIEIKKEGNFKGFQITPLLLLPLIENAFKHSQDIKKQFVSFSFQIQNNIFLFRCENSIGQENTKKNSNKIGLENVKKRLEILYKNQHTFEISQKENTFLVVLAVEF